MLWRSVRQLERELNLRPPEHNVYVIDNAKLLSGVEYVFNVTPIADHGEVGETRSFGIDNLQGNSELQNIDGRGEMFSVMLLGGDIAVADQEYILEAHVTTCLPTQDYQFIWTVHNSDTSEAITFRQYNASTLIIPPHTLQAGFPYDVSCQVVKYSTESFITQTDLKITVKKTGLEVYLSVITLIVSTSHAFTIDTFVVNHDSSQDAIVYEWWCTYDGDSCNDFNTSNQDHVVFSSGFSASGTYEVGVIVKSNEQTAQDNATIIAVDPVLPVIQVVPVSRIQNEGAVFTLVANATNVAPSCNLTWYFASQENLSLNNDTCDSCYHGEALSDALTIYSLEENFLNEIADYTNETEWRQMAVNMTAAAGRARFVAQCGCSLTFDCDMEGLAYADITIQLNHSPKPSRLLISPETGVALETLFRLSTLSVLDPDTPMRYSFYCNVGDHKTLLLGSYLEHTAIETRLPYIDVGTEVWVEVCDALGACSSTHPVTVHLSAGDGRSLYTLIEEARGHYRRCELIYFKKCVFSAITTYANSNLQKELSIFTRQVYDLIQGADDDHCIHELEDYYYLVQFVINSLTV